MTLRYLLQTSETALEFFKSLPLETQLAIARRYEVESEEELRRYAARMFRTGGIAAG